MYRHVQCLYTRLVLWKVKHHTKKTPRWVVQKEDCGRRPFCFSTMGRHFGINRQCSEIIRKEQGGLRAQTVSCLSPYCDVAMSFCYQGAGQMGTLNASFTGQLTHTQLFVRFRTGPKLFSMVGNKIAAVKGILGDFFHPHTRTDYCLK